MSKLVPNQQLQKNRDDAIQRTEREKRKKEREIIEAEKQKLKRKKEEQRNAKAAAYEKRIREEAERIKRLLHDQHRTFAHIAWENLR